MRAPDRPDPPDLADLPGPLFPPDQPPPASRAQVIAVGSAFALLCIVAGTGIIATRNGEFIIYLAVLLTLGGIILLLHRKLRFSAGMLWALWVWAALHMAGGLVPVPESWPINGDIRVLYSWWLIPDMLKYDHVVHALGFGIATTAVWQGLSRIWPEEGGLRPTWGLLIVSAICGMGLGGMNEVVEFIATLVTDTNVGGYINTGWDLVSNLAGCIIAAVIIRVRESARRRRGRAAG